MKKLLVVVLGLAVVLSISAFAQDASQGMGKSDKDAAAPLKSLKGTIKADGDKYTFVGDKDKKTWEVMNPEALKGREGHHVELKARVCRQGPDSRHGSEDVEGRFYVRPPTAV